MIHPYRRTGPRIHPTAFVEASAEPIRRSATDHVALDNDYLGAG